MLWHMLLEVALVFALAYAGGPFWSCLKGPKHLQEMLGNRDELTRLIDLAGYSNLLADAQNIKPLLNGNYGDNIFLWDNAHLKSLSSTRNALFFVVMGILALSWWIGIWYFAVSLAIFLLFGCMELPGVAKNNNAKHLLSVIVNLIKWRQDDEGECATFCMIERPAYGNLYKVLTWFQMKSATAQE
ncbi:MAG TPA: hypothetical protein VJW20_21290 [Candidatus Angelobacter sp.]|nr:hypothetical protein [Candidatus Angelobacter sp.]